MNIKTAVRGVSLALGVFSYAVSSCATPRIETWTTDNGARVLFVQATELPMVDIRIAFDAGSARDAGVPGLAVFTNGMLSEGAGQLDAETISERIENSGAMLSNGAQRDLAWVGLRSLTDPQVLDRAVSTFSEVVQRPDFPAAAVERARKLLLVALKQRDQNPAAVAENLFYAKLYPKHSYGSAPEGNAASLAQIRRRDLRSFFQRYYVGRNALVAIIGNLQQSTAKALVQRLVGRLPAGEPAAPIPPAPAHPEIAEVRRQHASTQTHILLGQAVLTRPDPDFYPLFVANHALGGNGLVSKLAEVIREQRGLSYSVASHFTAMRAAGPFEASIETRNEQAGEALQLLQKTIADYVHTGPNEAELEAAKQNIIGGFPLRIDGNGKILEYLVAIGLYDLPLDYLEQFVTRIQQVSAAQVRDALRRRLKPEDFLTVVVGGAAAVRPSAAAAQPAREHQP